MYASSVAIEASAQSSYSPNYEEALDLIHAFSGSGNELQRATSIVEELYKTDPNSGYAQTLIAEMLSTWELNQQGKPEALRAQIVKLTDEALALNPLLAQAYVARGRALLRASLYQEAQTAIDGALTIDPNLSGAFFLRAEIFRRTSRVHEAEIWYMKFIESTPSRTRKSNAYYWLGQTYANAAYTRPAEQSVLLPKAKSAYKKMLEFDADGAWKNVNFAIFLNHLGQDLDDAERYAQKALSLMEFPMARHHLAIARYQKILEPMNTMDDLALKAAVDQVSKTTRVPLGDAINFSGSSAPIKVRLQKIEARLLKR